MFRPYSPLLLTLAIGLWHHASAQDSFPSRFGLCASPTSSSLRVEGEAWESTGSRTSLSPGMLWDLRWGSSGHWGIGIGLLYTAIGGSLQGDTTVNEGQGPTRVTGAVDLRMRYLEIPFTVTLRTTSPRPLDYYAMAGVSGAYNLNSRGFGSRTVDKANGQSTTTIYDNTSFNEEIDKFKASVVLGAGVEYQLASGLILITGIKYSAALNNALRKGYSPLYVSDNIKTRIFPNYAEITLGMYIHSWQYQIFRNY